MKEKGERITTTVLNEQEILFGAMLSKDKNYYNVCADMMSCFDKLSYNQNCVPNVVKVIYQLEKTGKRVGLINEIIAGICLTNNATLVTRNTNHFSRIPVIKLYSW